MDGQLTPTTDSNWPPKELLGKNFIISSPGLRMGTLADVIGVEAAEAFFAEEDVFAEARKAAAARRAGHLVNPYMPEMG